MEITFMIIKLVASLIVVLGVMYITFKFANNGVQGINKDKYIKIIDRTQISKDSALIIVKIGDEGWIMSTSNGKTEKLKEISEEEIKKIEAIKEDRVKNFSKPWETFEENLKTKIRQMIKKTRAKDEKNE